MATEAEKMSSKAKRVEELKGLISDKLIAERKAKAAEVKKAFAGELKTMKRLKDELSKIETPLKEKLEKEGYSLSYNGEDIEVKTYGYNFPEQVEKDLTKIKELLVLGRDDEAQEKVDSLVKQFGLGK